jgi:arylsulfatase A-like enzyme
MISSPGSAGSRSAGRLAPVELCALAACCGLASGLLEVATRVLWHHIDVQQRMYMMSRHFVWLAPLADVLVFSVVGVIVAIVGALWPRSGRWLGSRLVCFLTVLPVLMVASSRIYAIAWIILALGIASQLAILIERHAAALRRILIFTFSGLLIVVLVVASSVFGPDWLKERREAGRALPASSAPNVLLLVLDTVRADRLSLYGYERPTTPNLDRLAHQGIRFDGARAAAPWTLPSHASFFTARWPHELGTKWISPLGEEFPTLAQYLGAHGYATAGFVGNTFLCSYETGLDLGFTHYEDYVLGRFGLFGTAWLPDQVLGVVSDAAVRLSRWLSPGSMRTRVELFFEPLFTRDRKKDAATVNGEFLRWLTHRRQPNRPFFAFLNYFDAHAPYVPPAGAPYAFGLKPEDQSDFMFLIEAWPTIPDKLHLAPRYQQLARDSYDNCIAYLDRQLGDLLEELRTLGVLDRTLLVIVSDHGEGLGEHGLFDHGESLYRTEIGVPLLFVPPSGEQHASIVNDSVSLRDLPATIVDFLDLRDSSPFPGRSLARFWRERPPRPDVATDVNAVISELPRPNPADPNRGRSPASRGPLVSLAMGDFVYIRNLGDGTEELFNERDDPRERDNRALLPSMMPVLDGFRQLFARLQQKSLRAVK